MSPWTLCGSATWATSNQFLFTVVPAARAPSAGNQPSCYVPGTGLVLSSGGNKTTHSEKMKRGTWKRPADLDPRGGESKATERRLAVPCALLTSCPQARGSPPRPVSAVPSPRANSPLPEPPQHSIPSPGRTVQRAEQSPAPGRALPSPP